MINSPKIKKIFHKSPLNRKIFTEAVKFSSQPKNSSNRMKCHAKLNHLKLLLMSERFAKLSQTFNFN